MNFLNKLQILNNINTFWCYLIIIIMANMTETRAWLLAQCGLNESYRVLHLSSHFKRIFLSIATETGNFPTFVETQWPALPTILYPQPSAHANGKRGDCDLIQQAVWSQVDGLARLWLMDSGEALVSQTNDIADRSSNKPSTKCSPKLMAFDLIREDIEVLRIDCGKYIKPGSSHLLDIQLGPRLTPCGSEKFIYFLLANDPHLLAYDILEQRWHYRLLQSKKYCTVAEFLPIKPKDIGFGKYQEILISDEDGMLYSTANAFHNKTTKQFDSIEMYPMGSLLGPTQDLMVDAYGVLFYGVPKYGAVVRCEYKMNMTAEDSEIIHMTSKNIQQIFFGQDGSSVWLLTDRWLKPSDQCFVGF